MNDKFTRRQKEWLLNLKDFLNPKFKMKSNFVKHIKNVQRIFKKKVVRFERLLKT
jgi:hypothetical protein